MVAQKKGPAEAATSPSHGSNNPRQENAVNKQHDTTASRDGATFDPFAYAELVFDVQMLARAASMMANTALFEDATPVQGLVAITKHEAELIAFLVDQVTRKAEAAVKAFDLSSINPTPIAEPSPAQTVREAIEAHRAAFVALGPLFEAESQSPSEEAKAALEAGEARENEAKAALMKARPTSLEEEAERMEYLFSYTGPWHAFVPTAQDGAHLVASLRAA